MLFPITFSIDNNLWCIWNYKSKNHLKDHHTVFNGYDNNQEFDQI